MPFALAFVASALLHVAALLGPGWALPGVLEPEPQPAIDAVLVRPTARTEAAVPAPKPAPRPAADKPRQQPAAAMAPVAPVAPVAMAPDAIPEPLQRSENQPPAAVPPAPTIDPPLAAPTPVRIALPGKGQLRYTITRGEGGFVIGQSVHTWEHDGLTYKMQSVTETTGLAALFRPARVVQSSKGEVSAEGLRPHEFRHERVGGLDTARFDWARRIVTYGGREESIGEGTQDMLSMYYQVVLAPPQSGALEMPIATGRKLENYRFEYLGEEVVVLPAGERRALRLKIKSGSDTIELWLGVGNGTEMRSLPLKIRFTDRKGEIFDQLAEDIAPRETE